MTIHDTPERTPITLDTAAALAQQALDRADAMPGSSVVLTPYVVRLLLEAAAPKPEAEPEPEPQGEGADHG